MGAMSHHHRENGTSLRCTRFWLTPLIAMLVTAASLGGVPSSAVAGTITPSRFYAEETGHSLSEPFLSYWIRHDGLSQLGLPVSEPVSYLDRQAQFFQRGYLIIAERSAGSASPRVVRGRAGEELLALRHEPDRLVAGRRAGSDRATAVFSRPAAGDAFVTGAAFSTFLKRIGGDEQFGDPLSPVYVTAGFRVQWYEFGRLQQALHDETITAAPVGLELARARGLDLTGVDGEGLPRIDARRFRRFEGDETVPEAPGPFSPVRIVIPKITIDANIERVGVTDGVMDVPKDPWNVGWYAVFSRPGERTNVTMSGHRDWWGIGPTVFWNLEQLAPGDKIYLIGKDGRGATYVVTETWQVDANTDAGAVIGDVGYEALTLITCGGAFTGTEYLSRHIVRAERI